MQGEKERESFSGMHYGDVLEIEALHMGCTSYFRSLCSCTDGLKLNKTQIINNKSNSVMLPCIAGIDTVATR